MNDKLVRRAGDDPAAFPQEWDGAIALARRRRAPGADINGLAYDVHGWSDGWLFEAMITQAGGRLLNEADDAIAFNGLVGLNALRTFRRFVTESSMTPIDWDQSRQQFDAGRTGIYLPSRANLQPIKGLVGASSRCATATFPISDRTNDRIPAGGSGVMIPARDPAKQRAAWECAKFVTGPEAQKVVVEMTGHLPTNRRRGARLPRPLVRRQPECGHADPAGRSREPLGRLSRRELGAHLARAARCDHAGDARGDHAGSRPGTHWHRDHADDARVGSISSRFIAGCIRSGAGIRARRSRRSACRSWARRANSIVIAGKTGREAR
jgi:hypothetical protein